MTDEKYNGWANYETWAVNLWLSNEDHTYRYWCKVAESYTEKPFHPPLREAQMLGDCLRDYYRDLADDIIPEASLFADLMKSSLDRVNWREIAEAFLEAINA